MYPENNLQVFLCWHTFSGLGPVKSERSAFGLRRQRPDKRVRRERCNRIIRNAHRLYPIRRQSFRNAVVLWEARFYRRVWWGIKIFFERDQRSDSRIDTCRFFRWGRILFLKNYWSQNGASLGKNHLILCQNICIVYFTSVYFKNC